MRRDRKFMVGLVGVAAVVTYLVWTGIGATMTYYVTPVELYAQMDSMPEFAFRGVRIAGEVLPESHVQASGELRHQFVLVDPEDRSVEILVEFRHPLPDTFSDDPSMLTEAVIEGRMREDGVFEATEVITKCGSRYEVVPEPPSGMPSARGPDAGSETKPAATSGGLDG